MPDNVLCVKPERPDNFVLVRSIIYFAESKHKVECVRTKVHCAARTCLLYVGWTPVTPSRVIHPFVPPPKGPKSYTTCQSYEQLNIMKEINTSSSVISNKISLAYSENLKGS